MTAVTGHRAGGPAHRWARVVVALAALGVTVGLATPAAAAEPLDRAEQIMELTHDEFGEVAQEREEPFDWSTDGCTTGGIPGTEEWAEFFQPACVQHDFGYRNFGGRGELKLDPTDSRRAWIDDRFRTEMRRLCDDSSDNRYMCYAAAQAAYQGVRSAGWMFF